MGWSRMCRTLADEPSLGIEDGDIQLVPTIRLIRDLRNILSIRSSVDCCRIEFNE